MESHRPAAAPLIARGRIWHQRLHPVRHAFDYASYFVLLPMRTLGSGCQGLSRNRRGLLSFYDEDHGVGGPDALAWLDLLLKAQGIDDADGPVWLQTYPRVLGYAFKPVSFWYAYRSDASLAAVVAEVNNTFGERHCYVLRDPSLQGGPATFADKVFHVSPFCSVAGYYAFKFQLTGGKANQPSPQAHIRAAVDLYQHIPGSVAATPPANAHLDDTRAPASPDQCMLRTTMQGVLQPLTRAAAWRAFLGVPLMTLNVVARIHWQALRLALLRVPFFSKPPAPLYPVTLSATGLNPSQVNAPPNQPAHPLVP